MKPINPAFNDCVQRMTAIMLPDGYDVTTDRTAVDTLEKITEHYHAEGRILISTNNTDNSIYCDIRTNLDFRAWHDYLHVTRGFTFTARGEANTCELHKRLIDLHLSHAFSRAQRAEFAVLLDIEINEQALYHIRTGQFVEDQYEFTLTKLQERQYDRAYK